MSEQGEKRKPRPHRCNDRVEDLIQACFTLEFDAKVWPAWRLMRQCFASQPGQEPTEGYLVIKDSRPYLDADAMTTKTPEDTS